MKINHSLFFNMYGREFGPLNRLQLDGLYSLLASIERDEALVNSNATLAIAIDQAAYMLATTMNETSRPGEGPTFRPVDETGTPNYFERCYGPHTCTGKALGNDQPGDGAKYYGRGYVQLTGKNNYMKATDRLLQEYPSVAADYESRTGQRFDLVISPDQAKDRALAYVVMSFGMREGRFTGKKLSDFFNSNLRDALHARQVIDGMDRASLIADYWEGFVTALKASTAT